MRYLKLFFLLTLTGYTCSALAQTSGPVSGLLPVPKYIQRLQGRFNLADSPVIETALPFTAETRLLGDSLNIPIKRRSGTITGSHILLQTYNPEDSLFKRTPMTRDSALMREAYRLAIRPEKIIIAATGPAGMFYGIQTLLALIRNQGTRLQAMTISDWPDFKIRGLSDDISRGQVSTMKNFKKIIRFMARYKMNTYMPYIEDTYRFKSMADIGADRGALTDAEWRELQSYAVSYHVQIIPAFQTLGHNENVLLKTRRHDIAEFPGAGSLRVNADSTYAFLDRELAEVTRTFKNPFFNMGADESWDVGKYRTKGNVERYGLATVHARHYKRVYDMLHKYGKKVMMYGDIVLRNPGILSDLPKDIVMMDWHYYPRINYPSVEVFANSAQPFIVSPGIHNWRRLFPIFTDALANMQGMAQDGLRYGAIGYITSNWGDYGGMNLRELGYYGYAYAGSVSWNSRDITQTSFDKLFFYRFYGEDNPVYSLIYQLLSESSSKIEWLNMVGHPFYPLEKGGIKEQRLAVQLPILQSQINAMIDRLRPSKNKAHLNYLRLAADFYGWYGRLQKLKIAMQRTVHNFDPIPVAMLQKLRSSAISLALDLKSLNKRYSSLWKRTNRSANLQRMTALWSRVATEILIKADEIAEGNLSFNGQLKTPFITMPYADEDQAVPHSYLRRVFYLKNKQRSAHLQLIANSDATIWVNEKYIGRIWARKSGSAMVEANRVKTWEIGKLLKPGKNIISVEVRNYVGGKASANVWLEMTDRKGNPEQIHSDKYWKAADVLFAGWKSPEFDDGAWPNAVDAKRNWIISRPYFKQGLPSRIEFYSGRGN